MRDRFGSASAVITLIALSLSTFTYVTTETLPIGLLSLIAHDLDSTTSAVGLLVTAYALVVVLASIPLT
jgi:DHA1 family inner membrane transport protein